MSDRNATEATYRAVKIYVASSWRNDEQPEIVQWLRDIGCDVYDFKNPPNRTGFGWHQTAAGRPSDGVTMQRTLQDPIAIAGFEEDMSALRACDLCILVMPAGISANMELGYAVGAGKTTIVYIPPYPDGKAFEPELMWKMADYVCASSEELGDAVCRIMVQRENAGVA
jgi:hypothetical protein